MKKISSIDIPDGDVSVGHRLRELRAARGLSIRALAEQSGLNVNTLSMIENGKTSPSVSTLQQVATALGAPITAFFETETHLRSIVYKKAQDHQSANFVHGTLADLGSGFSRHGLEPFVVNLAPHADSGDASIVHTGLEFVYCLEGCIIYEVEGEAFTLYAGDSLLFEAHLPHRWQNAGDVPSRSLLILCPSDERDHPDERHFTKGT
jgi:transcriptional regulator with XRE-family HTH domain